MSAVLHVSFKNINNTLKCKKTYVCREALQPRRLICHEFVKDRRKLQLVLPIQNDPLLHLLVLLRHVTTQSEDGEAATEHD